MLSELKWKTETKRMKTPMGCACSPTFVCVFVFVLSLVIWYILDAALGIRVSEEDELNGLDTSELGMDAYPDFSKT